MITPPDIAERPRATELHAYLAAIIESCDDAIISTRLDGVVTSWNPAAERLFGYSAAEMIDRPIATLIPEDRVEEETRLIQQLRSGVPASHFETVWRTKDGQPVDISLTVSLIRDAQGQIVGVSKIAREITERKWAEEFYLRFVSIINSAMDAIISVDEEQRVVLFNLAAQRMFECSAAEAIDAPLERFLPERFREAHRHHVAGFGESETAMRGMGRLGEVSALRRDGSEFLVEASISQATVGGKKFYTVILRDTTERKRAEATMALLNEDLAWQAARLQEANKELEAFSYSVSHDLRAPLRHVQGYARMLMRDAGDRLSEKAHRYLQTICDASREMGKLIDDLLAFSRMGRVQMTEARVEMNGLLRDTLHSLEATTRGREIDWKIQSLPEVQGDAAMLKLVLSNLLGNAVKYTGKRDRAQIEVGSAGWEEERIVFFVRDNGAGFDPQFAHKLFGVFQRLHRAEEFEGTGIGLANVRRIISRHGGRTWAEGAVNEGATFYFTLKPAVLADPVQFNR